MRTGIFDQYIKYYFLLIMYFKNVNVVFSVKYTM